MDNNDDISPNLFLLVAIIIFLVIVNCVILFQDFYSSFLFAAQVVLQIVSQVHHSWADRKAINPVLSLWKLSLDRYHHCVDSKQPLKVDAQKPCKSDNDSNKILAVNDQKMTIEEVKMMLENFSLDDGDYESEEEEINPEEVREAFGVFDKNGDGFIDAGELRNVLCKLELTEFSSEEECRRMIRVFDVNGDGKIDLDEFMTLLEH